MTNFDIENTYENKFVIGVDEAGLGPLAGPIVVCACFIPEKTFFYPEEYSITDSKKLSKKQREKLFEVIMNDKNIITSVSVTEPSQIDSKGLSCAWKEGIFNAIYGIKENFDVCLIDGNKTYDIPGKIVQSIVKGDQKSYSIATASIVAKVMRDGIMQGIHKEYPMYGFDKNVGYGTKQHMDALKKFGATKYHRKSYKPVSDVLS